MALAAIAILYIVFLKYQNGSLQDDLADEQKDNALYKERLDTTTLMANENAKALIMQYKEYQEQMRSIEVYYKGKLAQAEAVQKIKERIPHEDDAPVAPVLRSTLERLRKTQSGTEDSY